MIVVLSPVVARSSGADDSSYDNPDLAACYEEPISPRTREIWAERRASPIGLDVPVTIGPVVTFYRDWAGRPSVRAGIYQIAVRSENARRDLQSRSGTIEDRIAVILGEYDWRVNCSVNLSAEADDRIWQAVKAIAGHGDIRWIGARTVGRQMPAE